MATYPRGAVAAGHHLTAVRFGITSGFAIRREWPRRRSLHLYAQFKWHTQRRRPGRVDDRRGDRRIAPVSRPPSSAALATGLEGGRAGGRTDGRTAEKFNHETFMRPGVLTIRRQIAKRRLSEIIRNLQLTGGRDAGGAVRQRPGTADVVDPLTDGLMAAERPGWALSIETISSGYLTHGSRRETTGDRVTRDAIDIVHF